MKNKIKETINEYVLDAKETFELLKEKFIKDLSDPKIRKKYIAGAVMLLVLTILIANLFNSFAYYSADDGVPLIEAKVGRMYIDDYDYTLLVFLESKNNDGYYELAENIPDIGYTYSGYNCLNNSTLNYDDGSKIARTTLKEKDVCSIYFNVSE